MTAQQPRWDAIIVAGGRASRLGGIDKTALVYDGRSLFQRAIDAVRLAEHVSVVGSNTLADSWKVRHTEESPRWGGPAAAIAAGLGNLRDSESEFTAVIAADLPHAADALRLLRDELGKVDDGIVAVDSTERLQPLLAIYRTVALRVAANLQPSTTDLSVRQLIGSLRLRTVRLPDRLCADIDTPADADRLGITLPSKPALAIR